MLYSNKRLSLKRTAQRCSGDFCQFQCPKWSVDCFQIHCKRFLFCRSPAESRWVEASAPDVACTNTLLPLCHWGGIAKSRCHPRELTQIFPLDETQSFDHSPELKSKERQECFHWWDKINNSTREGFRTSWINEDKTHPFSPRIRVWERPPVVAISSCWCVWLCRLSEHIDAVNPLQRQAFVWLDDLLWCWMPYLGNTLGQVHWSVHWTVIPGTKLNELHKKTDSS